MLEPESLELDRELELELDLELEADCWLSLLVFDLERRDRVFFLWSWESD